MTKKLNTTLFFAIAIIIAGCSQILQAPKLKVETIDRLSQQEFLIVEKTLTLSEAKSRRSDPFIRSVIQTGIGDRARLVSEDVAVKSNFPTQEKKGSYNEYELGIGDEISFINLIENSKTKKAAGEVFMQIPVNQVSEPYTIGISDKISFFNLIEKSTSPESLIEDWKQESSDTSYVVGIGDEITLIQISEQDKSVNSVMLQAPKNDDGNASNSGTLKKFSSPPDNSNNIIQTSGRVGSDGNLLLLEVGTLQASGKTINALRSEVRNVLIRNGISPKFQLEITAFKSQKAYISLSSNTSGRLQGSGRVLPITDQPLTLREVLSSSGVSELPEATTSVRLKRGQSNYSLKLNQIYAAFAPQIILKDQDHIFVDQGLSLVKEKIGTVLNNGYIILPDLGQIKVEGKTIAEIERVVEKISAKKGLNYWKDFQIKITGFNSKSFFLTTTATASGNSNAASKRFPITDRPTTLKDVLLNASITEKPGANTDIILQRGQSKYSFKLEEIYAASAPKIILKDQDHIFLAEGAPSLRRGKVTVDNKGNVFLPDLGNIKVEGKSITEVEEEAKNLSLRKGLNYWKDFQIKLVSSGSQRAIITYPSTIEEVFITNNSKIVPITDIPQRLDEVLVSLGVKTTTGTLTKVNLLREGTTSTFVYEDILLDPSKEIYLKDGDRIRVEILAYKPSKVFIMGSGLLPRIFEISPSVRQTLADILFTPNGALSSFSAQRSEIYLLRGDDQITAYHLDALNPSRILVAEAMELRPNDILFVAEQPLISFNRTLQTILPLRLLIDDIRTEATSDVPVITVPSSNETSD